MPASRGSWSPSRAAPPTWRARRLHSPRPTRTWRPAWPGPSRAARWWPRRARGGLPTLRMAGEVADGVHVHPMNTLDSLRQTLVPNLDEGARRAGRDPAALAVFVPLFTVVGDTDEERARWREASRTMVGFYGSTPNYAFIFDQIGFEGTTERLRAAQKSGDPAAPGRVVTDELLAHFVVEGTWTG